MSGTVDLDSFELETDGNSATQTLDISGQITGAGGSIDKDDDFTLILRNATNDYSGITNIDNGIVRITNATALGDDTGDGLRSEELRRVVVAALVGHQIALHCGVDTAGMDHATENPIDAAAQQATAGQNRAAEIRSAAGVSGEMPVAVS